mgnify:CR=1 FL=1
MDREKVGEVGMPEIDKSIYAQIAIKCLICESYRELTREEVEYNRYYGTTGSIYICDRCKSAIEWAKERMEGR